MRYLYIIYFLSTLTILSQESQIPINTQTIFFSINHAYQTPVGNLSNRFGHNSDISFTLAYLAKNNILVNLEAGFLFGPTVKEPTLFQLIDGDNGNLISQNGEIPTIRLFERGGHIDLNCGKFFEFKNTKNRSGIVLTFGLGYIYHKIFIETLVTQLPQINETLLKGYDQLHGGIVSKEFIGYMHLSKLNNIRFLIGLEAMQGFTKNLRGYNYDTQLFTDNTQIDHLIGIKCGIIIPIKQRSVERYYYF